MFISIIIPTFNSIKYIENCLDSIFLQYLPNVEVFVIDNGSNDSTSEFVKKKYPQIKCIANKENRGSSIARNQGIKASSGEFVMFLDSDAYLGEDFLINLEKILKNFPDDVAGISPKIINNDLNSIFSCGLTISSLYRVYDIEQSASRDKLLKDRTIGGFNSCCAILRKRYLEDISEHNRYFDEDFFFLFEDADLSLRLKNKGYRFLFRPEIICFHNKGSSNIQGDYRRYLCFRNRWYIILKNNRGKKLALFLLRSFLYDLFRTLHFSITNKYFLRATQDIYSYYKLSREKNINI